MLKPPTVHLFTDAQRPPRRLVVAVVAALGLLTGPAAADALADNDALFTQTNDPAGNAVQKFDRADDGSLSPAGMFVTGGVGLAVQGGRQGAVELSDDEDTVYAINAGSNSVTAFRVRDDDGQKPGSRSSAPSRRAASPR